MRLLDNLFFKDTYYIRNKISIKMRNKDSTILPQLKMFGPLPNSTYIVLPPTENKNNEDDIEDYDDLLSMFLIFAFL